MPENPEVTDKARLVKHTEVVTNDGEKPRVYVLYLGEYQVASAVMQPGMNGNISWQGLSTVEEPYWRIDFYEVVEPPADFGLFNAVVVRDTPAGLRAKERWQAIYDAGDGSEDTAGYWMQVAYECLLDQEEARDGS